MKDTLRHVMEATGYVNDGVPAEGVRLEDEARNSRRGRSFEPDAVWLGSSSLKVYFKATDALPTDDEVAAWRDEIWNEGFSPLLWVISPARIDLYNGFGRPVPPSEVQQHRLRTFEVIETQLNELDALAGRLSMESGQFWLQTSSVDRKTAVDRQLLSDLRVLEHDLVSDGLERTEAQALIGRSIFTQYLVDRDIVTSSRLEALCHRATFSAALRDQSAAGNLFDWLARTFNGDMFPKTAATPPSSGHLARIADFLDAMDPVTGQMTFFPYQFDIIPVELISSIYEQFAHSAAAPIDGRSRSTEASQDGVYYTRLPVVSLVLDEVMADVDGTETVLDLTCGSGVFLVEAFRRLVHRQAKGVPPARGAIRQILYEQIYGVDRSEAAVRVAAFSLYLAALEVDHDPQPPEGLTFEPLIGRTLFVGDARSIEETAEGARALCVDGMRKRFDLIVGNPPWSFKGQAGTRGRRSQGTSTPAQPRGEGLDFVLRAAEFSHDRTRFGMVLSAMPFFAGSRTGAEAARHVVRTLTPVTLVNLSNLRSWLFSGAGMPAMVLFARHRRQPADRMTIVQVPWPPEGAKSQTFEISPSDISELSLSAWSNRPERLKAAMFGRRRDQHLLDRLLDAHDPLSHQLKVLGTDFRDGVILGNPENRNLDASAIRDLGHLGVRQLKHFAVPEILEPFGFDAAQWPRNRDIYRAPILLLKELFIGQPRALTAVAEKDIAFAHGLYGATFADVEQAAPHVIAGMLSSALASWFFLLSSAEFGLWKRRLLVHDVKRLPVPDIRTMLETEAGRSLERVCRSLAGQEPSSDDWRALDAAVYDVYGLTQDERIVVDDGLFRAGYEWRAGLLKSVEPARAEIDVAAYAETFVHVMDRWFAARGKRRMHAEVYDLKPSDALRVVRFSLEDGPGPSSVRLLRPDEDLMTVLRRIGDRLDVPLTSTVSGQRELRVHGHDEVVIIKPAARRHWLRSLALEDADAVVSESFRGPPA